MCVKDRWATDSTFHASWMCALLSNTDENVEGWSGLLFCGSFLRSTELALFSRYFQVKMCLISLLPSLLPSCMWITSPPTQKTFPLLSCGISAPSPDSPLLCHPPSLGAAVPGLGPFPPLLARYLEFVCSGVHPDEFPDVPSVFPLFAGVPSAACPGSCFSAVFLFFSPNR